MTSSSDDDELASYDTTTTPFRSEKVKNATLNSKTSAARQKVNGRATIAVAGPSTTRASRPRARNVRNSPTEYLDEEDGGVNEGINGPRTAGYTAQQPMFIDVVETDVEVTEVPATAAKRSGRQKRGASREPDSTSAPSKTNKAPQRSGKGKAPAKRANSPVTMEISDTTDNVREEADVPVRSKASALRKDKQKVTATSEREILKLQRRIELLQQQVEDTSTQRNAFVSQLEEAFSAQNTEAEELMQEQALQYELRLQKQEEMIQELSSSLARADSLNREGKTSALHFLTREAADEERRGLEAEMERLKVAVETQKQIVAERDKTIRDLQADLQTARSDLEIEIQNSKALASRTRDLPSSPAKARLQPKTSMAKQSLVTNLYEDMTNFLIITVKEEEHGMYGGKEIVFVCVYTHSDTKAGTKKGLTFSLRVYNDETELQTDEEDNVKVLYTALELDKESDEFVNGLDFLAGNFTFRRTQMDAFLERLNVVMSALLDKPEQD